MLRKHHWYIFLVIREDSDLGELNMETKVKDGSNAIQNKLQILLDAEKPSACLHIVLVIKYSAYNN